MITNVSHSTSMITHVL